MGQEEPVQIVSSAGLSLVMWNLVEGPSLPDSYVEVTEGGSSLSRDWTPPEKRGEAGTQTWKIWLRKNIWQKGRKRTQYTRLKTRNVLHQQVTCCILWRNPRISFYCWRQYVLTKHWWFTVWRNRLCDNKSAGTPPRIMVHWNNLLDDPYVILL